MDFDRKKYETPYKKGEPVLKKSGLKFDSVLVDLPFVFKHSGRYFMMYIGFDGTGYQGALAVSDKIDGEYGFYSLILNREKGHGWDNVNIAGAHIMSTQDFDGMKKLKKIDGKYWLLYHAYPDSGYEQGSAKIGLAYCEDEDLKNWTRLEKPILETDPSIEWEGGTLYKECVVEKDGIYYMYYNARNVPKDENGWKEQIGFCTSKDLFSWKRYEKNPVIKPGDFDWDTNYNADPFIVKDGDIYVNFYYAYGGGHAQAAVAYSKDLINWTKEDKPLITHGKPGEIDSLHAHKSCVVKEDGVVYHFYCAVGEGDKWGDRHCITVARSKPY